MRNQGRRGWAERWLRFGRRSESQGGASTPSSPSWLVLALACLLYVFGHAPVSGQPELQLVGGLGAALFFGAAGAAGSWASRRYALGRIAVFAVLFAAMGVSFNLAIHPRSRPLAAADILQGMAICGLSVALWRRLFGEHWWADAILMAAPMAVQQLSGGRLPGFPGSQYLIEGVAGEASPSLFPLCPWLTLAILGAWAERVNMYGNLAAALVFGAGAAALGWIDPDGAGFVKFPMNLPYALLSGAAVAWAYALAKSAETLPALPTIGRWLGRRWLLFFYMHFAAAQVIPLARLKSAPSIWGAVALLSLAGTGALGWVLKPLGRWFRGPIPWLVLLGLVATAGEAPGLPLPAVLLLAWGAGIVFGTHYEGLAACVGGTPSEFGPAADQVRKVPSERDEALRRGEVPRDDATIPSLRGELPDRRELGKGFAWLCLVLAFLALPEVLRLISGDWPRDSTSALPTISAPSASSATP